MNVEKSQKVYKHFGLSLSDDDCTRGSAWCVLIYSGIAFRPRYIFNPMRINIDDDGNQEVRE